MTHAPEIGAINQLHFLAPVFGADFRNMQLELIKFSGAENKYG